ncbi:MAG TPA: VOC family protein [Solirubrobacterales bacterium]
MSANGSIDPGTSIGAVRLRVADLDRIRRFYEDAIGLAVLDSTEGRARLGVNGATLVELVGDPSAPERPRNSTGLFHLAILVPSRGDLAAALHRVVESGWRLSGASDHLVSEALYLSDPEGNGIEIYRDRPRDQWPIRDGAIEMSTEPLDLDGVLRELRKEEPDRGMLAGTRIGHVHLNVADLTAAEAFYSGALGFDITVRGYPGALFVSAGGYHHHVGLNTWAGEGAPPPPSGSRGLEYFEVSLPGMAQLAAEEDRLREAGFEPRREDDRVLVTDPSGNGVALTAAG